MRTTVKTIWLALVWACALLSGLIRRTAAQDVGFVPPTVRAASAIVIDGNTGATLWAKSPDLRLPPASTTKIATGLLLASDLPPDQSVPTSAQAARTPGHALGMQPGETFRARDLLYAILLASANDASAAAAEKMAGSEPAFAARMTDWARQNGAGNTRFANASGLPAPGHYSTARDLAAMARAALQNPTFANVVRTRSYVLPRADGRPSTPLTNENTLLGVVPGMDGVKAGWTRKAGACFVGSATRKGRRIITVVLNSPDWQRETTSLLDYGFKAQQRQPPPSPHIAASANRNDTIAPAGKQALNAPHTLTKAHPAKSNTPPVPAGRTDAPDVSAQPVTPTPQAMSALPDTSNAQSNAAGHVPTRLMDAASSVPAQSRDASRSAPTTVGTPPASGIPGQTDALLPAPKSDRTHPPLTPLSGSERANQSPVSGNPSETAAGFWPLPRSPGASASVRANPSFDTARGLSEKGSPNAPRSYMQPAPPDLRSGKRSSSPLLDHPLAADAPRSRLFWAVRLLLGLGLLFLIGLLAFGLLRAWKGHWTMPDIFAGLWGRRRKSDPLPASDASGMLPVQPRVAAPLLRPAFTFAAPLLDRQEGRVWLEGVLETPTRLLEPAARRIARGLRDSDPHLCQDRMPGLLSPPNPRLRLAGAELRGRHTPRQAEETLLALLKDERVAADVRAEAVQSLAELGGDRNERVFLQMLLRDGSPPAAHALARLPELEDASVQAMQAVLAGGGDAPPGEGELKRNLRNAHIACALMAQGHLARPDAAPYLNALPANHGEPILVTTLRGSRNPQAVECLIDIVLHGHAYPALQSLLDADPRLIRAALDLPGKPLDRAQQTRQTILKWFALGEGNDAQIQELANAGNDLARGAMQLHRLHHWEPGLIAPDALCAASQIYSLRLGFSGHAQNDIALAFRKAATDGEAQSLAALPPELRPLAQAYAHPDVYEAVQALMHTDDALPSLLAALSRQLDNPAYRRELAFWCDKMPHDTRLMLTQALSKNAANPDTPASEDDATTRATLAARACDPAAPIRSAALRWLRRHPATTEQATQAEEHHEDYAYTDPAHPAPVAVREDGNR